MFIHLDDAGQLQHDNDCTVIITGKNVLLEKSYENYKKLMAFKGENNQHFQKYIPHAIEKISSQELKVTFYERAYSLNYVLQKFNDKLDQPHVNWILSRIMELATWLNKIDYVHCGLNLDSLYIIPRNHGLVCLSFYHMTPVNEKLSSISGRYVNLYPSYNLVTKLATPNIDIVSAKKTALRLMGDKSYIGEVFNNDVHYNENLIKYLRQEDHDTLNSYNTYRDILRAHYNTKQFHQLIIEENDNRTA